MQKIGLDVGMKITLPDEILAAVNYNSNKINILNTLLAKKGQIVTVSGSRPLKFKKDYLHFVGFKEKLFQARCGVSYDNLASREGMVNQGLNGKRFLIYPYILKSSSNKLLFRFYRINNSFKPTVKYIVQGNEVGVEELAQYCLASEYKEEDNQSTLFDYPIDSINLVK